MKNNYNKSKELIKNSELSIKGIKTFIGREGYGVNAHLCYKGKKVAFIIDSGNGGEMTVDWNWDCNKSCYSPKVEDAQVYVKTLIKSLPVTLWKDIGRDFASSDLDEYKWDEESVANTLIDYELEIQDFTKTMRKVCVLTDSNRIATYTKKPKDLNVVFQFKEGRMTLRDYIKRDKSVKIILNDLPTLKAFDYYNQCTNK